MRGKKNTFKRALLSTLSIAILSTTLAGCSSLREWQVFGSTGAGSAVSTEAGAGTEISQETAVLAEVRPNDALPEAETAIQPSKPGAKPSTSPSSSEEENNAERRPQVALTFDDGPDIKYTVQILDLLKEYDVKATFFLVGTQVKKYPDIAKRIVDEGHSVGNHSWSHGDLTKLSAKARAEQIDKTQAIIVEATGTTPRLMRAPYGSVSKEVLATIHKDHMKHVAWTVDTKDWAGTSVQDMYKNVMNNSRDGGIILMHSFGGRKNALEHTVKLLPSIIRDLRTNGYDLVTIDEMIDSGDYKVSAIK